jgi:hypothetical protein
MNSNDPQPSSEPSGIGKVLRAILRTILTLILVVFILAALIAVGYYGVVYVHNEAIVPAQNARASLAALSTSQAQSNLNYRALTARLNDLAIVHSQDATKIDSLNDSLGDLQTVLQTQNQTLNRLDALETNLNLLTQRMEASSTTNGELQSTLAANDLSYQDLQTQVKILQAMELLNRSRLYLLQSNFGLASSDVDGARQILLALQPDLPSYQQDALGLWVQRLTLAIGNLPGYPIQAGDDLEIAWGLLAAGLPPQPTGTPTVSSIPLTTTTTGTPTPYSNSLLTPTPLSSISPIATATPYTYSTAIPPHNLTITPTPSGT